MHQYIFIIIFTVIIIASHINHNITNNHLAANPAFSVHVNFLLAAQLLFKTYELYSTVATYVAANLV